MKLIRPTNNTITGDYNNSHKAYDFSGFGSDEIKAGKDGQIVIRENRFDRSWQANTPNDPYLIPGIIRILRTEDYGNFIKIKHDDGTFELMAHLAKDSSLPIGTRVKAGQVVAKIGNTGNSTGKHLHYEARLGNDVNVQPEFIEGGEAPVNNDAKKAVHYDRLVSYYKSIGYPLFPTDHSEDYVNTDKVEEATKAIYEETQRQSREIERLNKIIASGGSEGLTKAKEKAVEIARLADDIINI